MARLALSVVGGILGAIFIPGVGASLGFAIGSAVGGIVGQLAFPGKGTHVYGPRLNDMQVSGSAPGTPIPLIYGSMRMGGQIIWSGGINEVTTTTKQSAKGGPSVTQTTYTYFSSFAAAFCLGPAKVTRIWGDSKLIYDKGGNAYKGVWSSSTTYAVGDIVSEGSNYWIANHPSTNLDPGSKTLFGNLIGELFWSPCPKPPDAGNIAANVHTIPTLYQGTTTQGQDPLMVSKDGASRVPAYRGVCYAVWEKMALADFGNRLPNIRGEVHANAADAPQTVLEGFDSPYDHGVPEYTALSPDQKTVWAWQVRGLGNSPSGRSHIYIERVDLLTNTITDSGFISNLAAFGYVDGSDNPPQGPGVVDGDSNIWMPGTSAGHACMYKIDGKTFQCVGVGTLFHPAPGGVGYSGAAYATPIGCVLDSTGTYLFGVSYYSLWSGLYIGGMVLWCMKTSDGSIVGQWPFNNGDDTCIVQGLPCVDDNNNVYLLMVNGSTFGVPDGTGWSVKKINAPGGTSLSIPSPSGYGLDGGIYTSVSTVCTQSTSDIPAAMLYCPDDHSLILVTTDGKIMKYDINSGTQLAATATGQVYCNTGSIGAASWNKMNDRGQGLPNIPATGSSASAHNLQRALGGRTQNGIFFTPGRTLATDGHLQGWSAADLSLLGDYNLNAFPQMNTEMVFGDYWAYEPTSNSVLLLVTNETAPGYPSTFSSRYAIYRLYLDRVNGAGQTASAIVLDICQRAGIDASNVDVSQLDSITVTGYPIPSLQTGKDMINNLGQAFFFEACESDFKIKFVPRGNSAVATLDESELGLIDDHASLEETIGQEQDLPKEVEVMYIDQALDYQQNKQNRVKHHKVRKTLNKTSISLPLVLTASQAQKLADRILWTADIERHQYKTNLWKSYWMLLDPTDVINFNYHGLQLTGRIATMTLGQNFAIAVEVIAEDTNNYLTVAGGDSTTGFIGQKIAGLATTQMWLLDIPLLRDGDADASGNTGFYVVMAPNSGGTWPAGLLFKSSDGLAWSQIDATTTPVTYGIVQGAALPSPTHSAYSWDFDSSLTVQLTEGTAPASDSDLNVLNGSNAALLFPSLEIIQFRDVTANPDGTYTLSTLLRGRRGTEWACGNHTSGEKVFFLNDGGVLHEQVGLSAFQSSRAYKAVTAGTDLSTGIEQDLTLASRDLMPYAPSHFQGTVDGSHNITMTWIRRTRIGGDWLSGGDSPGTYIGPQNGMAVPLSEDSESYDVEIIKHVGGNDVVIRTFSGLTSPTVVYTSAQQVTDFGSNQTALHARVYQNSAQVGRGFVTDVADVLGGLAPVGGGSDATSIQGIPVSTATPNDGDVLTYVAANADWEPVAPGGGSALARNTFTKTTGSLAPAAAETGVMTIAKSFYVLKVTADQKCRVQLYATTALRDADSGRAVGVTPTGQHGCFCDVNLDTDTSLSFIMDDPQLGANMESSVSSSIAYRITNNSASTVTVTANITVVPLET